MSAHVFAAAGQEGVRLQEVRDAPARPTEGIFGLREIERVALNERDLVSTSRKGKGRGEPGTASSEYGNTELAHAEAVY